MVWEVPHNSTPEMWAASCAEFNIIMIMSIAQAAAARCSVAPSDVVASEK